MHHGNGVFECGACFRRGRARNLFVDEILGVVDQHAGWVALRIAQNLAAGRIFRRGSERGNAHGRCVHQRRVAIHTREHHRMIGNRGGQLLVGGEARVTPGVLIPSASQNPTAFRGGFRAFDHASDHVVVGACTHQVDCTERLREPAKVGMRIDHPGYDRLAGGVDYTRVRPLECLGFLT